MTLDTAYFKQGDTQTDLKVVLTDDRGAVDISTGVSSVKFTMTEQGTGNVILSLQSCTINTESGTLPNGFTYNRTVSYAWQSQDVATIGTYNGEWLVTFTNGKTRKFPTGKPAYKTIVIQADLN